MSVFHMFSRLSGWPLGKYIFARLFCFKAPYFGTIKPIFYVVEPGKCVAKIKKRRAVLNHIGTVHAIAMCNLAEAVGGLCIEVTLPKHLRWIPRGMTVEYLKKAETELEGVCEIDADSLVVGDNKVEVGVFDKENQKVFRAVID
ncbi:MAG: hotdog fold domain-containing protein, partial [Pseudomonadota bacterium]